MRAFYQALNAELPQVGGRRRRLSAIRSRLFARAEAPDIDARPPVSEEDAQSLYERTLDQMKALVGARIKLAPQRLVSTEPLERYGIDSIAITGLNQDLGDVFGEISKTLWFEHPTLSDLTRYFVETHADVCARWCAPASTRTVATASPLSERRPVAMARQEPIAIIGVSGRYPMADSLEAFWKNLEAGKDCITRSRRCAGRSRAFITPTGKRPSRKPKATGSVAASSTVSPISIHCSSTSPGRERDEMDPQERLFLQCAWEALEDAGYTRETLRTRFDRNVGVFAE